jgi:hypothetical protein
VPAAIARILLLAACAAGLAACKGGAVTEWRLQQDAESLASIAADGQLLAAETAKGESTHPFTEVHAQELRKEADQLADVLDSADPRPGLERPTAQLVAAARRAADQLQTLEDHPGERTVALGVRDALGDLVDRADEIGKQA